MKVSVICRDMHKSENMSILSHNLTQTYTVVQQNIETSGSELQLPPPRVTLYLNTCTPGILNVADLTDADRKEFLQMAYYGLLGRLPEEPVLRRWENEGQLSERAYRKAVLDTLLENPEAAAKGRVILNNIYADEEGGQGHVHRSLKQRIWTFGYKVSRRLPLSVKIWLKKLAMKLLVKG